MLPVTYQGTPHSIMQIPPDKLKLLREIIRAEIYKSWKYILNDCIPHMIGKEVLRLQQEFKEFETVSPAKKIPLEHYTNNIMKILEDK